MTLLIMHSIVGDRDMRILLTTASLLALAACAPVQRPEAIAVMTNDPDADAIAFALGAIRPRASVEGL